MEIDILEQFDDIAVIALPVEGFEKLSRKEKMIAYRLWHAAVAGDPITYEQNYRYGILLRNLFLDICQKIDLISEDNLRDQIEEYTKKIIIHHGNHDARTTRKFVPKFSAKDLQDAIDAIDDPIINSARSMIPDEVIFEDKFEQMLTNKNAADIIKQSYNTFYDNLSLAQVDAYDDKNPSNSSLENKDGTIIAHVWRAGNNRIGPGLYAEHINRMCYHLHHAMEHADLAQREVLGLLKRYFEEGEPGQFDEYNIKWLSSDTKVDTILGFIEEYRDALSRRALYEGMVFFQDSSTQHIIASIASKAQTLEDETPWEGKYKKVWTKIPVSNAIMQIVGTGGAGPLCWAGVNLPNSQKIREEHGSKSIYISNVTYASRNASAKKMFTEFIENDKDRKMILNTLIDRGPITVTLHEIVGHGSGRSSSSLEKDPREYLKENYSTLEEARAELCMLYHAFSPSLKGIISEECAKAIFLSYILSDITWLRVLRDDDELHEDHMRATHLIVQYIIRNSDAAAFYKKDGKTYAKVNDYALMRRKIAELLAELQRIKSEGDYDSLKRLVEEYAISFDQDLRDEVIERSRKADIPAQAVYVMPEPILIDGDVRLSYPRSILEQGLRWRELGD